MKTLFKCIIILWITVLNSLNSTPPIPDHINKISNGNWDAYKQILDRNTDYVKMHDFIDVINENGYNQRYFGIMEVRAIIFKLGQFTWDKKQKKEISEYLSDYYLNYVKDENFLKDQALLFFSNEKAKEILKDVKSLVQNLLTVYNMYEDGYILGWNMDIPATLLRLILRYDPIQALPIIEKEWINYYNKSLEGSFYFKEFKFGILKNLEWALTNINDIEYKKFFFISIESIVNNVNEIKKTTVKKDFSYFFEVKEVFNFNNQERAWEYLKSKEEKLKTIPDLGYEDLRKICWIAYERMRDAYYELDEEVLFKLEEKATGNGKDYYAKILMTVFNLCDYYDKDKEMSEIKYEQYKNVIESFAKRTKDSKMKTACENVLKNAKSKMK